MVRVCREQGSICSCGSVYADVPGLSFVLCAVREGFLGEIVEATIPAGLPVEMAGAGCVPLTLLRLLAQQEIVWAEGDTLPPLAGWTDTPDVNDWEVDCPAYGRVGLAGGGICDIPRPGSPLATTGMITVKGTAGTATLRSDGPLMDPIRANFHLVLSMRTHLKYASVGC